MTAYLHNRSTYTWAFLTLITLVSWWIGRGHGAEFHIDPAIAVSVLLIALIKSRFVLREFMEVRTAPLWLRRVFDALLFVLFAALFSIYYFSL